MLNVASQLWLNSDSEFSTFIKKYQVPNIPE